MRRPWFIILVLLPALLAATGCSSSSSKAATVAGVDISKSSIDEDLKSINSSDAYRSALEQSYGIQMAGASTGSFNTDFVAQVLSLRVYYQLIEDALSKAGQKVTAEDEATADAAVKEQFAGVDGGDAILSGFSKSYREELVRQQAVVTAARRMVLAEAGDPETFFNAHKADFGPQTCAAHILVSTQTKADGSAGLSDADALAKATDLKRQLDGGASFATLATSSSDDSAPQGDLGCHGPGTYVTEFETAMNAATIGQVTSPVSSPYGYHLILVRERRATPTYDQVKDDVAAALDQQSGTALNTLLTNLTCDKATSVTVDSKYGTWDQSDCGGTTNGLGKVVAPATSTTTSLPGTTSTTAGTGGTTTTTAPK